jgi:hypothetical protein
MIDYRIAEDDVYDLFDEIVESILEDEDQELINTFFLALVVRLIDEDKISLTDNELNLFQMLEVILADVTYGDDVFDDIDDKHTEINLQQFFYDVVTKVVKYLTKEYDFKDFIEDSELSKTEEKLVKRGLREFFKSFK